MAADDQILDTLDPGAPFVHSREAEPEPEKKPEAASDRVAALERELEQEREERRYWAGRANRQPAPVEEPEEEEAPAPRRQAAAQVEETSDEFLNDLANNKLEALRKRGLITQEEMDEKLADLRAEITQKVSNDLAAQAEGERFDRDLEASFPEIWDDNLKLNAWVKGGEAGPRPQVSEAYKVAAKAYKQMVADAGGDLTPGASRALLRTAAQQATNETKGRTVNRNEDHEPRRSQESIRRERIEAISGRDSRSGPEGEAGGTRDFNSAQRQVMAKLGVKGEEFTRFSGKGSIAHGR